MKTIPLTRGFVATVDDEEYERLSKFKWQVMIDSKTGAPRAVRSLPRKYIYMSREIAIPPEDKQVDHKNGNTLDNRKDNLRICSPGENLANIGKRTGNKSGYKGVVWHRDGRKWMANCGGYIGLFNTPEAAAKAYDEKAFNKWGDFAQLNFPRK